MLWVCMVYRRGGSGGSDYVNVHVHVNVNW